MSFLLCLVYVDVLTTTSCSKDDTGTGTVTDGGSVPDGASPPDGVVVADSKEDDTALPDAPPTDTTNDSNEPDGLLDAPVDTMVMIDGGVDAPDPIDGFPIDAMDPLVDAPEPLIDALEPLVDAPPIPIDAEFFVDAAPDA